ncbi:MAG: ThuA domain-containing protein [Pirellulales bacterium]|nr:ThuA domain-containing protein [Pirellulales bacterium]
MRVIMVRGLILIGVLFLWFANQRGVQAAGQSSQEKIRVLVVTGGHGFEEEPFAALFAAIPDIAATHTTYPSVAEKLAPPLTKDFDVLVLYDMWAQGITPEQQAAFVALLNQGIGVVGLHHTLAAHQKWDEYTKILGGKFYTEERTIDEKTFPAGTAIHGQELQIHVADSDHPITRGLENFTIHDETYGGFHVEPGVHLLLSTDHPQNNREIAWTTAYGKSRVCYIQLGHDHFAYEHPSYRTLVARSIRWAAGKPADPQAEGIAIFNGKDLTGWIAEGNAHWEVTDGQLIGRQGPHNAPGDLFTEASYDDFELTVTYKIIWPANSGIWYRYQAPDRAYQADILEYQNPLAYSGTLYCPGKMFLAINEDPKLVDREGWNELRIRVVGDRHVIFLNGKKVADVRDGQFRNGRIGIQIHPGDEFAKMQINIQKMHLQKL